MSGLSGEDRARLETTADLLEYRANRLQPMDMANYLTHREALFADAEAIRTALALIDQQEKADQAQRVAIWVLQARVDQQEKALEAADELERAAATFRCNLPPTGDGPDADRGDALLDAELAYRSARSVSG